ncbi:DNA-directed RNA polymerase subunit delta [Spiroplasma culicicola]|uniref:RNAP delta factor n=1 Tax=Spiroplasma culicicola AES-1 TaxID=1276246 RepID=W6A8N2_9MOLU|nr:DNA-directed RNA polymerase subunit delta [Spiroplasma culicicola]AHI53377.1 DNA directed RNA polymerase subunit delta [Spiroplasma culicicola AES-1]
MANIPTIDLAFEYLQKNKGDASFEDIWNSISKDIVGSNEDKNEIIAELYSDLVLDNRFALTSDGKWGLRDYLKFDDIKKQYDYVDKFETTEEFEDIDSYVFDDSDITGKLGKAKIMLDSSNDDDDDEETDTEDDISIDMDDDYDD